MMARDGKRRNRANVLDESTQRKDSTGGTYMIPTRTPGGALSGGRTIGFHAAFAPPFASPAAQSGRHATNQPKGWNNG